MYFTRPGILSKLLVVEVRVHTTSGMTRAIVVFAAALSLAAQDSRFDVRSRLVVVPVSVVDLKGHSVDGLEAADFLLFDNGRRQNVAVDTIDTGVAPIALIVAVQASGISTAALEKVRKIGSMIQPVVTGERGCAGLVSFADRVTWLQECTKDADTLGRAFSRLRPALQPGGDNKQGRMLDAVQSAVERLRRQPNARRVLLLISESRDRGSEAALDVVTIAAQSAGVTVYAATYSAFATAFTSKAPVTPPAGTRAPSPKPPSEETMKTNNGAPPSKYNPKIPPPEERVDVLGGLRELSRLGTANTPEVLARNTGGATFPFARERALESVIQKLGAELHAQYVLSFVPEGSAPGYHTLEVRLSRPGEFRIRSRPGYWSAEEASPPQNPHDQ
jgi:VWFA-related protein